MDCGQAQSLFTAYEDREIDQRNLQLFELHLAACSHCAQEWQDFQKMLRLLQTVEPLPVPPDLLPGIHEKLAGAGFGARIGRALQKFFIPAPLTAVASLTAAALVAAIAIKSPTIYDQVTTASPPAQMPQTEQAETRRPPLVTLPVSVGRPKTDYPELPPRLSGLDRNTYKSLLEREGADLSQLAIWHDHFFRFQDNLVSFEEERQTAGTPRWQVGTPLVPDITIRMHYLSADGLKWLHSRIKEEGRWQTRFYPHDYFLVLVNPDELPTLYNMLQRQHLPFSTHSRPETERATQRPLLVAVRP